MERHTNASQDEQLWVSFLNGSETAFASLYSTYFKILYNYGGKFTSDRDVIKDAIQDLFVKLWEKREELHDVSSPRFYLLKAMRHKMLDALTGKKKFVYEDAPVDDRFEFVLPQEALLISHQMSREQEASVLQALNTLTPRQKEVIFLRFYNNLSYEEIAALMSVSVDSCYNLLSKALSAIKKNIVKVGLMLFLFFNSLVPDVKQ